MDGIHDLGGVQGFGPVERRPDDVAISEDWERDALRATLAVNIALSVGGPVFRHSIERMDPAHYLTSPYYEHWLTGAATLLVESGAVSHAELERRAGGSFPLSRPPRGAAPDDPGDDRTAPRFAVGDRVRVRDVHRLSHSRVPRFVQGREGEVTRLDGAFPYPDLECFGVRVLDPTYSVRFATGELWGDGAIDDATVNVDLYERDLDPA